MFIWVDAFLFLLNNLLMYTLSYNKHFNNICIHLFSGNLCIRHATSLASELYTINTRHFKSMRIVYSEMASHEEICVKFAVNTSY